MSEENRDLTKKEIKNLSLEMRCCFFLQSWNINFKGNTVGEWSKHLGHFRFTDEKKLIGEKMAVQEVKNLITFVKDLKEVSELGRKDG